MNNPLSFHFVRLLHQLGQQVRFGENSFKMAGYYPCRFTNSSDQHERFLEVILRGILENRPGTFIDVGVNAGQTLAKVLGIEKDRLYLGFEPQLSCCFNADQFIKANDLLNAKVLPIALSNNNRLMSFFSDGETDECASLIDRKDFAGNRVKDFVQCRIGDDILKELGVTQISAIKIDVEGAELQVLEGLKTTLTYSRPPIIFEVLPNFSGMGQRTWHPPDICEKNRLSAQQIYHLLSEAGYQIFQIDENSCRETMIERFDLDDIKNFKGSNFIAHPV
jgi:FkbM family methyltransferase